MEKYQAKHRKSVMSISSTDSLNEDDINEKFKKIVTKIRNNPSNPKRENNTINIESNLEKAKEKEKEIIPLQSSKTVVSGEKKILLNEEDTDKIDELVNQEMKKPEVKNKNVNVEAIKKVFEKSFRQKAKDIKKNSLFGNLDSHKIKYLN